MIHQPIAATLHLVFETLCSDVIKVACQQAASLEEVGPRWTSITYNRVLPQSILLQNTIISQT